MKTAEELGNMAHMADEVRGYLNVASVFTENDREVKHEMNMAENYLQDLAYLMGFDLVKRKEEDK